jgi:hypothetical protein
LYADPDPDPAARINADPCGSGYGSGSETLVDCTLSNNVELFIPSTLPTPPPPPRSGSRTELSCTPATIRVKGQSNKMVLVFVKESAEPTPWILDSGSDCKQISVGTGIDLVTVVEVMPLVSSVSTNLQ